MNENIKKFVEKISHDQETVAKLSAIRDPDEAYALASSLQGGFTKEEFVSAMDKLSAAAGNGDISDDDLLKYAGGGTTEILVSGTGSAVSGVSLTMALAEAAI